MRTCALRCLATDHPLLVDEQRGSAHQQRKHRRRGKYAAAAPRCYQGAREVGGRHAADGGGRPAQRLQRPRRRLRLGNDNTVWRVGTSGFSISPSIALDAQRSDCRDPAVACGWFKDSGFCVKSGCWRVAGASVSSAEPCAADNLMFAGRTGWKDDIATAAQVARAAGSWDAVSAAAARAQKPYPITLVKNRAHVPVLVPVLDSCPEPWSRALRFR